MCQIVSAEEYEVRTDTFSIHLYIKSLFSGFPFNGRGVCVRRHFVLPFGWNQTSFRAATIIIISLGFVSSISISHFSHSHTASINEISARIQNKKQSPHFPRFRTSPSRFTFLFSLLLSLRNVFLNLVRLCFFPSFDIQIQYQACWVSLLLPNFSAVEGFDFMPADWKQSLKQKNATL